MTVVCRFRHLDTKVRLKAVSAASSRRESFNEGSSPSPEPDNKTSPKRSPVLGRKNENGFDSKQN